MDAPRREKAGTVRDWMSREPVTVTPDVSIEHVIRLMRARGIRHLLVMDGERLAGIVSNRDVRRLLLGGDHTIPPSAPVRRIMTEGVVTVSPQTPLTVAARQLLDRKIGALPVVEGDRPIGILTKSDALEALLAWAEGPE
jgi:CBS domain-containing protein